jgi:hypothetical protein
VRISSVHAVHPYLVCLINACGVLQRRLLLLPAAEVLLEVFINKLILNATKTASTP